MISATRTHFSRCCDNRPRTSAAISACAQGALRRDGGAGRRSPPGHDASERAKRSSTTRASAAKRATRTERAGEARASERVGESEGRSPSAKEEVNGARWPSRSSKSVVSRVEREGWVRLPGTSAIRPPGPTSITLSGKEHVRPDKHHSVSARQAAPCPGPISITPARPDKHTPSRPDKHRPVPARQASPSQPQPVEDQLLPFGARETGSRTGSATSWPGRRIEPRGAHRLPWRRCLPGRAERRTRIVACGTWTSRR